ncbi:MAG: hypothetical protein ICV71_01380 [Thermoleophilia bacterium]|nr:hypothetical protein [Thermoleophilia bacterium]
MRDPGLDRHEWESEWQALEADLEDSPREALPELGDLIERMLLEHGFPINDEVADDGIEPDILVEFRSAREVAQRVERGEDVDPGDIGEAIENFRDIYRQLSERSA